MTVPGPSRFGVAAAGARRRHACLVGVVVVPMGLRMPINRTSAWAAVLAAAASSVVACSTVVPGVAVNAGSGPLMVADLRLLDTGSYPTTPLPALGTAGTYSRGAVVEAQRMANYVVGPWEVDTALEAKHSVGVLLIDGTDKLTLIGPAELASVSQRHNFINGFVSARQASNGDRSLLNAVLRFGDPPSAAAAVSDLGRTDLAGPPNSAAAQRVSIPGHPDAVATSYTVIDPQSRRERVAVRSFVLRGQYVLTQLAESVAGRDAAARLVANAINLQAIVIDQFPAIDPADFAEIALDPTGLLARTLPLAPGEATMVQNARFGKRGALHFQSDPIRSSALFDRTIMDGLVRAKTNVYRSSDAVAALGIVDQFAAEVAETAGKPVDGAKFIRTSRCMQLTTGFYCLASKDRYVMEAHSQSLDDAHQQVAAQYTLLVGY